MLVYETFYNFVSLNKIETDNKGGYYEKNNNNIKLRATMMCIMTAAAPYSTRALRYNHITRRMSCQVSSLNLRASPHQHLFGVVMLKSGSWFERYVYDGAEGGTLKKNPIIGDEYLAEVKENHEVLINEI